MTIETMPEGETYLRIDCDELFVSLETVLKEYSAGMKSSEPTGRLKVKMVNPSATVETVDFAAVQCKKIATIMVDTSKAEYDQFPEGSAFVLEDVIISDGVVTCQTFIPLP